MNRVIEVDDERYFAIVEPGVAYFDLYRHIQDRHLKVWGRIPGGMGRLRPKGFCGIRVQADAMGRVVVSDVIAGTAAQAAGMRAGDVLRSVGGVEIHNTTESVDRIGSYLEGDEVEFGIERGGESRAIKVRLGKRPDDLEN
jgi:S1-C subfamily serine protease